MPVNRAGGQCSQGTREPHHHPLIPSPLISHPRNTHTRVAKPTDFTAGSPVNPCIPALPHALCLARPLSLSCCPTDTAWSHGDAPAHPAHQAEWGDAEVTHGDTSAATSVQVSFLMTQKICEYIPLQTASISLQRLRTTVIDESA